MADAKIDKSLDDIIKERHIGRGGRGGGIGGGARGRGGPRGRGGARANTAPGGGQQQQRGGGVRRQNTAAGGAGGIMKRRSAGGAQFSPAKAASINGQWGHDLYANNAGGGGRRSAAAGGVAAATAIVSASSGPAKLVISNLDFGVNDNDIKGLFQEFGNIRKAAVHYDRSGRSLGTADVMFERKADALRAQKKYNGVSLDGRPMNIQFTAPVGTVPVPESTRIYTPPTGQQQQNTGGASARGGNGFRANGAGRGRGRGGSQRGSGGGAGAGGQRAPRAKKVERSAADLDAELDAYNTSNGMQTD